MPAKKKAASQTASPELVDVVSPKTPKKPGRKRAVVEETTLPVEVAPTSDPAPQPQPAPAASTASTGSSLSRADVEAIARQLIESRVREIVSFEARKAIEAIMAEYEVVTEDDAPSKTPTQAKPAPAPARPLGTERTELLREAIRECIRRKSSREGELVSFLSADLTILRSWLHKTEMGSEICLAMVERLAVWQMEEEKAAAAAEEDAEDEDETHESCELPSHEDDLAQLDETADEADPASSAQASEDSSHEDDHGHEDDHSPILPPI